MAGSIKTKAQTVVVARLNPGDDILESIQRIVKEHNITSGYLNAIGAISRATLGFFDSVKGEYRTIDIDRHLEVASCMGNISTLKDGTIVVHVHMVASDRQGNCYGGHVMPGCKVSVTLEILITGINYQLLRAYDEKIGLNLLDLQLD